MYQANALALIVASGTIVPERSSAFTAWCPSSLMDAKTILPLPRRMVFSRFDNTFFIFFGLLTDGFIVV
jgi:hypothetical protein